MIDHWWQTETGWAIAANPVGVEQLPLKPGSPTVPMPGYDVQILHPDWFGLRPRRRRRDLHPPAATAGNPTHTMGRRRPIRGVVSVRAPRLLPDRGWRLSRRRRLPFVMGRIDDVINVAGHRLSTGAIEVVIAAHPAVAECAVIGGRRPDQGSGAAGPRRPKRVHLRRV